MIYYGYETFREDTKTLVAAVRPYAPDALVSVARGGMMLGQFISYGLDLRNIHSVRVEAYDGEERRERATVLGHCDLSGAQRVLIVDDIVDSGMTLEALLESLRNAYPQAEFRTAAIFHKPSASLQPDFSVREATEWIDFFWESDLAGV